VAGNVKSAAGTVQQKAGELFGSDEQQAKGAARDASGQAKVRRVPHRHSSAARGVLCLDGCPWGLYVVSVVWA
jgi:hypothetical protein